MCDCDCDCIFVCEMDWTRTACKSNLHKKFKSTHKISTRWLCHVHKLSTIFKQYSKAIQTLIRTSRLYFDLSKYELIHLYQCQLLYKAKIVPQNEAVFSFYSVVILVSIIAALTLLAIIVSNSSSTLKNIFLHIYNKMHGIAMGIENDENRKIRTGSNELHSKVENDNESSVAVDVVVVVFLRYKCFKSFKRAKKWTARQRSCD